MHLDTEYGDDGVQEASCIVVGAQTAGRGIPGMNYWR